MKKRGEYIPAELVDTTQTYDATLLDPSVDVSPYDPPKHENSEPVDRQHERMQAAERIAKSFWDVHADKTDPARWKRDFFFSHIVDYSALAVATDEQKEEAYQHFEEKLLPLTTFDYREKK